MRGGIWIGGIPTLQGLRVKGNSYFGGAAGAESLIVRPGVNAVNYIDIIGYQSGSSPVLSSWGSDANIGLRISSKGTGIVSIYTNGSNQQQFQISHVANAVNYWQALGSATGNGINLKASGSDTNISAYVLGKGNGTVVIGNDNGNGLTVTGIGANYLTVIGGSAGNNPSISSVGTDANISIRHIAKGSGSVILENTQGISFSATSQAGAINYVTAQSVGNVGPSSGPILQTNGTDPNTGLQLSTKGTGVINFYTNAVNQLQFKINHVANAVNYIAVLGGATGIAPIISVAGSDADIDIAMVPKGNGVIQFGTFTASGDVAINGSISIKDAAGNVRKLATVA